MNTFWTDSLIWFKELSKCTKGRHVIKCKLEMPRGANVISITKGETRILLHAIINGDSVNEVETHEFVIYVINLTTCSDSKNSSSDGLIIHDQTFEFLNTLSLENYGEEQIIHVFHKKDP